MNTSETQISEDGRELWDLATRVADHIHRQALVAEKKKQLRDCGAACGDCDYWMKSSLCPKEHNVNGRNRGPSMNGMKCGKFIETREANERRARLIGEIASLMSNKGNAI